MSEKRKETEETVNEKKVKKPLIRAYTDEELTAMTAVELGARFSANCCSLESNTVELKKLLGEKICSKIKWLDKPTAVISTEMDRQDGSIGSNVIFCMGDVIGAEKNGTFLSFDPLLNVFALYQTGEYLSSCFETDISEITEWVNKTYKRV